MRKVALCLFGLFRSFERIYPLMMKNFKLEEGDILDIFICTSNYDNHKTRFRVDRKFYHNKDILDKRIRTLIGSKLKKLFIMDERDCIKDGSWEARWIYPRCFKSYNVLKMVQKYQEENNIYYDNIIYHRMDIIFVDWKTADDYYEQRRVGEERKRGLKYIDKYNFPIGLLEHGCCCIQDIPKDTDICINLSDMKDNELLCYEDYYIGHVPIDFFICNGKLLPIIIEFYDNYTNKRYIQFTRNGQRINSLQSYDKKDKWWLYEDSKINSLEVQLRVHLEKYHIVVNELRFRKDIAVLYIR